MFQVSAIRLGSKFEQSFNSWNEANDKAKWLATQGFEASITRARVPKMEDI